MSDTPHPEAELIAYLRGELREDDRRRVADHVAACPECATAGEEFREILRTLETSRPEPPPIHWGAYRATLREKMAARRGRTRWRWRWLSWQVPVGLSAVAAGVLLFLALQNGLHRPALNGDLWSLEETIAARRLDLLRQYALFERLDLWDDLDVVRRLDQLSPGRRG